MLRYEKHNFENELKDIFSYNYKKPGSTLIKYTRPKFILTVTNTLSVITELSFAMRGFKNILTISNMLCVITELSFAMRGLKTYINHIQYALRNNRT